MIVQLKFGIFELGHVSKKKKEFFFVVNVNSGFMVLYLILTVDH